MKDRDEAIRRLSHHLREKGFPRLQFTAILALAGVAGVAAAFFLLKAGLIHMGFRYPIAAFFAYGVFLISLKWWRDYQVKGMERLAELSDPGGGSGAPPEAVVPGDRGRALDWTDYLSIPLEILSGSIIFYLVVGVAVLLTAGIVFYAPIFLGEVLLDGLLVSGLWRRLQKVRSGLEGRGFLEAVLRKTWLPALLVTTFLAIAGAILHQAFPGAVSIGDLFKRH